MHQALCSGLVKAILQTRSTGRLTAVPVDACCLPPPPQQEANCVAVLQDDLCTLQAAGLVESGARPQHPSVLSSLHTLQLNTSLQVGYLLSTMVTRPHFWTLRTTACSSRVRLLKSRLSVQRSLLSNDFTPSLVMVVL